MANEARCAPPFLRCILTINTRMQPLLLTLLQNLFHVLRAGEFLKTWRRRWFVMKEGKLYWFKSDIIGPVRFLCIRMCNIFTFFKHIHLLLTTPCFRFFVVVHHRQFSYFLITLSLSLSLRAEHRTSRHYRNQPLPVHQRR